MCSHFAPHLTRRLCGFFILDWGFCALKAARNLYWRRRWSSSPGLLYLLFGQIQATDVQQDLRVSWLGCGNRLDSGLGLHDLHPHGGCHQDHTVWWAAHWGGRAASCVKTTSAGSIFTHSVASSSNVLVSPSAFSIPSFCCSLWTIHPSFLPAED